MKLNFTLHIATLLSFLITSVDSLCLFKGLSVKRLADGAVLDLNQHLQTNKSTFLVLGTYAADFNAIEYGQRLRYYLPFLKEKGIEKFIMILNASPNAARVFAEQIDIQQEVELLCDSTGSAGRAFGVSKGWKPDDKELSPYIKLFGMLFGLGAWATLPSVISGYIGNPWSKQPWIEAALAHGQSVGRWPDTALEIENDSASGTMKVLKNKFSDLAGVGDWGCRPLELATLRLQNMIGISLNNWDALKPTDDELQAGVLTQLGGCVVIGTDGTPRYQWRDEGICHVPNFEDILKAI